MTSQPETFQAGRGLPRLEAALSLVWRRVGVLEGKLAEASGRLFSTWDQRVERKVDSPDSIEREAGREHERHGSNIVPRHNVHVHHHAVQLVPREEQLHKVLRRPQRLVRELGARVREEAEQREKCRAMQQW
eukprot:scaffold26226_cov79-Phaeocystis_antarctica.AAC.3